MRFILASALVLLGVIGAQWALAGQLVVVDSTAAALLPGQVLDGSKPLSLNAGTQVTVISEDGKVSTFKGPFSGLPASGGGGGGGSGGGLLASLSKLVGDQGGSGSLGVMRAVKAGEAPDPWVIDVLRSGSHCVRAGVAPVLWRPGTRKGAKLTLKPLPKGKRTSIDWPAGMDGIDWPEGLALADGGRYLVKMSGRMTAAKMVIHIVPADLPSDAHRVAWMADKGCTGQARALLAGLR